MIRTGGIVFAIVYLLTGSLFPNASQPLWIEHWIQGVELAKSGKHQNALDAYSLSIVSIPNPTPLSLYLHLERAFLWSEVGQYVKAIEDFSRVIDDKNFPTADKALALRGRASAYAKLKEKKKWRKDAKQADLLSPLITVLYQDQYYSIAKSYGAMDANSDKISDVTKFFKSFNLVDSEKDIVFSPTGLVLIKKKGGCVAAQ